MYNKAWYETHREQINEKRRMRHAEDSEQVNEKRRQEPRITHDGERRSCASSERIAKNVHTVTSPFVDAICRNTSPPGTSASRWREREENNKMTLNEKEWTSRPSYS